LEATRSATMANRADQYTPFGSLTWSQDPTNPDKWTQNINLDPDTQAALNSQQDVQKYLSDLAQKYEGKVATGMDKPYNEQGPMPSYDPGGMLSLNTSAAQQPMPGLDYSGLGPEAQLDYSSLGEMPDLGYGEVESIRNAMMSRLQPDLEKQAAARRQALAAQGITQGSEIQDTAEGQIGRNFNDANQQALLGAMGAYDTITGRQLAGRAQKAGELRDIYGSKVAARADQQKQLENLYQASMGGRKQALSEADLAFQRGLQGRQQAAAEYGTKMTGRQQALQEEAYERSLPLQELNALLRGNAVQGPQFPGFAQQAATAGPDLYGAADSQYQAALAGSNAQKQQAAGIGRAVGTVAGGLLGSFAGPGGTVIGAGLGGGLGGAAGGMFA
jgi:hypothetical protein